MNIWHPAPRGLINSAATERWTRKRPAPEIVVYLWVWSQRDEGAPPTRRQVAKIFGWTEHYARTMIRRVKADMDEWEQYTSLRKVTAKRPPQPSKNGQVRNRSAHNHNTEPDQALEGMREWQAIK